VTLPSDGRIKETFKIRIKEAAEINMEELHRFLRGETKCTTNCLTGLYQKYKEQAQIM
jgi:eukaryotic translation initiation factor 2C